MNRSKFWIKLIIVNTWREFREKDSHGAQSANTGATE